jgi:hypothetical protein
MLQLTAQMVLALNFRAITYQLLVRGEENKFAAHFTVTLIQNLKTTHNFTARRFVSDTQPSLCPSILVDTLLESGGATVHLKLFKAQGTAPILIYLCSSQIKQSVRSSFTFKRI